MIGLTIDKEESGNDDHQDEDPPHLWFDKEAKEAAEFYASAFPDSRVTNVSVIRDTPSGDCDVVTFEVWGCRGPAIL